MEKEKILKKNQKLKKDKGETLKEEIEKLKNEKLEILAEFSNFRKRKEEEIIEIRDRAIISFVNSILPSIENFELSLKMRDNTEMFSKGVEMIHKNLLETLKEHKVESYETKIGEEFNPKFHDPVLVEKDEKNENHKFGLVLSNISKGYRHKNRIIKHERVGVLKEE